MHKISWRITALVEGDTVLAITLAKPTYDSFEKILSRFKGIFHIWINSLRRVHPQYIQSS